PQVDVIALLKRQAVERASQPHLDRAAGFGKAGDCIGHTAIASVFDELTHALDQLVERVDVMQRGLHRVAHREVSARRNYRRNSGAGLDLRSEGADYAMPVVDRRVRDCRDLVLELDEIHRTHRRPHCQSCPRTHWRSSWPHRLETMRSPPRLSAPAEAPARKPALPGGARCRNWSAIHPWSCSRSVGPKSFA